MQLFNVILYQNSKFDSLRHGLTFQIENPLKLQKSLKRFIWYKNNILQHLC